MPEYGVFTAPWKTLLSFFAQSGRRYDQPRKNSVISITFHYCYQNQQDFTVIFIAQHAKPFYVNWSLFWTYLKEKKHYDERFKKPREMS